METVIVSNTIQCNKCGDVIYSKHRHDYVSCSCGTVAVDGGTDYAELSIVMNKDTIDKCLEAMQWADETKRNERGKLYAILRVLRDDGVELNVNR